jgi:DNA-binding transcriptional ArsR family regulator
MQASDTQEVVQVLGALAQETRLDAFRVLVQAGPGGVAAGEIARQLGIPPPTLSFHLKAMLHADLVESRREGRSLFYSANFEVLNRVLRYLTENCCQGVLCDSTDLADDSAGSADPG